jgi:hypothetical protein
MLSSSSAFMYLFSCGQDDALITMTGFNHAIFMSSYNTSLLFFISTHLMLLQDATFSNYRDATIQ